MIKKLVLFLVAVCSAVMAENKTAHSIVIEESAKAYFKLDGDFYSDEKGNILQYAGKSVNLGVTAGYTVVSANAAYGEGKSVEIKQTAENENKYSFAMPDADVVIKGTFKKKTSSISVSGCEQMKCSYPESALFEDDVKLVVTRTSNQGFDSKANVGVTQTVSGNVVTFEFKMPAYDVEFEFVMGTPVAKPTKFKLNVACSAVKSCVFKDAKNNVIDSANVNDEVHLFMEKPSEEGNLGIEGDGLGDDELKMVENAEHYKFTMPENDVSIAINFLSLEPSNEENLPGSSSSESEIDSSDSEENPNSSSSEISDTVYVVDTTAYYIVEIASSENGEIVRTGSFVKGTENAAYEDYDITLYAYPKEGYALDTIFVETTDGDAVKLQKKGDAYTFKMPASDVTVSAKYKIAEYNIVINGCEKLKCEAPAKAKMGDEISVKISLTAGVTGFRTSAQGIGSINQEQKESDVFLSFKMPDNDVTLNLDVSMEESLSSDSKDDDKSSSSANEDDGKSSSSSKEKSKSDKEKKDAIVAFQVPNFHVVVLNRKINVSASAGSLYVLTDMNGCVLAKGVVAGENFGIAVSNAGRFILRIGSQVRVVNIK